MFGSDNQAPAHPSVLQAMVHANAGSAPSYGADPWSDRARELIAATFETDDLDIYFVATGGAANGLALSQLVRPWGAVVCAPDAHIIADEGSGPELFTGGARLLPVGGPGTMIGPQELDAVHAAHPASFVHGMQPRAVSLTNLTETGRAWDPAQLASTCARAHDHGWSVHVDGARFGNAVVAAGASPAALSWQAGVDALSFGLTKTGAAMAEAVILFGAARTDPSLPYARKRAGQLISKHRFLAAQFVAMLQDGLWLRLAADANAIAAELAQIFTQAGIELVFETPGTARGNEVFARLDPQAQAALTSAGVSFYPWLPGGPGCCRFVAGWTSTDEHVRTLARALI